MKLGSHYVPLLGFIYSYFALNIPCWSRFGLFIYIFLFPIFSFIYLYLHTFSLICPYLVIFTLNCPNLTIYAIFTLHIYSSKLLNKRNPYLTSVTYYLDFGNCNPHYLVPNCSAINLESNDGNHKRFAFRATLPE